MIYEHLDLLKRMVDEGYVNVQKHPTFDYYIYNYSQTTQFEKKWNEATLQARGLILNGSGEIIARPFKKFFNFQEHQNNQIPWNESYTVLEKMDGSLLIGYTGEDGRSYVASRGSFTSDQANWGNQILNLKYSFLSDINPCSIIHLCKEYTVLYELLWPSNRIVIDYGDIEDVVTLGMVNKVTGEIVSPDKIYNPSGRYYSIPHIFDVSDIKELLSHEKDNFEGYVVRFESGFTMKVKLDEYVRLHRLVTGVSNVSIWESLKNGDNIESLLKNVPDEFYEWVSVIINDLKSKYSKIESDSIEVYNELNGYERSYIAKKLLNEYPKHKKVLAHIVFAMMDGKKYNEIIWKMIRPEYQKPFFQNRDSAND